MGVGGQDHNPAALPPGNETRYSLYRKLGGPQGRSERVRKISPQPGFDPGTVQSVANRYTAILAHSATCSVLKNGIILIPINCTCKNCSDVTSTCCLMTNMFRLLTAILWQNSYHKRITLCRSTAFLWVRDSTSTSLPAYRVHLHISSVLSTFCKFCKKVCKPGSHWMWRWAQYPVWARWWHHYDCCPCSDLNLGPAVGSPGQCYNKSCWRRSLWILLTYGMWHRTVWKTLRQFGGTCVLHLPYSTLKMETEGLSETLVLSIQRRKAPS
jgi:hypothetical protein